MVPAYTVQVFKSGIWDKKERRNIIAENAQRAAELVCGSKVRDRGKPGELRARVWPKGRTAPEYVFYADATD